MMTRSPRSCVLLLLVAAAVPASAQLATRPSRGPAPVAELDGAQASLGEEGERILGALALARSTGLDVVDGVRYGAGPDYKVELDGRGFLYTLPLGSSAPESGTLSFELDSIRLGDRLLVSAAEGAAASHAGSVVTYARGASIRERYEVRSDGLEQSFVFDSLPRGGGDLVVRGRISTSLVASGLDGSPGTGSFPDGLRFESPGFGSFVYGGVTGIDARGERVRGDLRFDGQWMELSLPADFVASAALPLTLDPLLGGVQIVTSQTDTLFSELAFDSTYGLYLVVWNRFWSATDADVYGQRVSPTGSLVGGLVMIEPFTAWDSEKATVANNNGSDRFLVAWRQTPSALGGGGDLASRIVNASDGGIGNTFLFAIDGFDPDAGGELLEGYDKVQVVWSSASGIRGTSIIVPVSGAPGSAGTYVLSNSATDSAPAISKSGGLPGRYLVVWQRPVDTFFLDLIARAVDYLGVPDPVTANLTPSSSATDMAPEVDGDGVDFVVAYQHHAGAPAADIHAKRVSWSPGSLQVNSGELVLQAGPVDKSLPDVVLLGRSAVGEPIKYAVAWEEGLFSSPAIRYREFDPADCSACGPLKTLTGVGTAGHFVSLASEFDAVSSGSAEGGMASFRYDYFDGSALAFVIAAQPLDALGPGGSIANIGGQCGSAGSIAYVGPAAVGNPAVNITLSGADPSAVIGFMNTAAPGTPVTCGACAWEPFSPLTVARPIVAGNATYTGVVPCEASLIGAVIRYQWTVAFTSSSPCPFAANISISDRLEVTYGE